jgi:predicted RNA-binding Zn ribbon-like protein
MVSIPSSAIPRDLDLVIDFVNTLDADTGRDELESGEGLTRWLAERGLLDGDEPQLTDAQRRQAINVREALRSAMRANNGEPWDDAAGAELEAAARRGRLGLCFAEQGSVNLTPEATGFDGALARLLIAVAEATRGGSWARVKACRAVDCQWAFYDRSRNRSGVWCDMAVCGNRTKVRAYRARRPPSTEAE